MSSHVDPSQSKCLPCLSQRTAPFYAASVRRCASIKKNTPSGNGSEVDQGTGDPKLEHDAPLYYWLPRRPCPIGSVGSKLNWWIVKNTRRLFCVGSSVLGGQIINGNVTSEAGELS